MVVVHRLVLVDITDIGMAHVYHFIMLLLVVFIKMETILVHSTHSTLDIIRH